MRKQTGAPPAPLPSPLAFLTCLASAPPGQGVFARDDVESVLWVLADIVWGGGHCIWKRVRAALSMLTSFEFRFGHVAHDACVLQMAQPEPRKILETRKRFLEEKFSSGQKAEAEIQKLLASLLQVRLSLGPQHQQLKPVILIRHTASAGGWQGRRRVLQDVRKELAEAALRSCQRHGVPTNKAENSKKDATDVFFLIGQAIVIIVSMPRRSSRRTCAAQPYSPGRRKRCRRPNRTRQTRQHCEV